MSCNLTEHAIAHSTPFCKLFINGAIKAKIKIFVVFFLIKNHIEVEREISSMMLNWHHSDSYSGTLTLKIFKNIVWTLFDGFLNFL